MSTEQVNAPMGVDNAAPMGGNVPELSPDLLNKPVRPDELQPSDPAVAQQLGLVKQKNQELLSKNRQLIDDLKGLRSEFEQLRTAQQSAVRENLESQGAYKELYEQERQRAQTLETRLINETTELKAELSNQKESVQRERLKAEATAEISRANALNPTQLYQLLSPQLRTGDNGAVCALDGGVEVPLADYVANLKQSGEWQHHFGASQHSGMNASSATIAPGMNNPYRGGNLTEALLLEAQNPELAAALKAEAARG